MAQQRRDKLEALIKHHAELLEPLNQGAGAAASGGPASKNRSGGAAATASAAASGANGDALVRQRYDDDEFTKSTFGHGTVTVTTTYGLPSFGVTQAPGDGSSSGGDSDGDSDSDGADASAGSSSAAGMLCTRALTS